MVLATDRAYYARSKDLKIKKLTADYADYADFKSKSKGKNKGKNKRFYREGNEEEKA